MEIKLEKLTNKDLDLFWLVFSQLLREGFPGYSPIVVAYFLNKIYTKEAFNSWLNNDWKIIFIAKEKDKIVGFSVIDRPYGGVCFLRWLGVLRQFRNKGIGKQLIREWINYAKKYGCHKVELASQPEAKDFYQKCGLEMEGERKLSYFGIDQFIFGKVIDKAKDEIMIKG